MKGRWVVDSWNLDHAQNEDKVRAEPFEAIELDLALLWEDVPADSEAAGNEEGGGAQRP